MQFGLPHPRKLLNVLKGLQEKSWNNVPRERLSDYGAQPYA